MAKPRNRAIPAERPGSVDSARFTAQSQRVERTLRGPRRIVKGFVTGLVGADDERIWSATFATGIPDLGSIDGVGSGAILGRIAADQRKDSPSQVEVELEYGFFAEDDFNNDPGGDPSVPQLEILSTVVPVVTHFDFRGNPIILEHVFAVTEGNATTLVRGPDQVAEVELQLPNHVVVYRRREQFSPGAKARRFVGTINSKGVFEDPKHFWMCTRLDGRTDDGGLSYNVTYEFQRNSDSWDPTVVYRDPKTGGPVVDPAGAARLNPTGVGELVGLKKVQIYQEQDFFDLDLRLPLQPGEIERP